jgi:hypothetical protein
MNFKFLRHGVEEEMGRARTRPAKIADVTHASACCGELQFTVIRTFLELPAKDRQQHDKSCATPCF